MVRLLGTTSNINGLNVTATGNSFTGGITHANTANRIYTLPDLTGTVALTSQTKLRTGFPDRTSTTLTWNTGTRTVTLAPTGSNFIVTVNGVVYTKTTQTSTIPAVTGGYFIYFDNTGTIQQSTTPWNILTTAPIAYIYYDSGLADGFCFEERHGDTMDPSTHYYLHNVNGTEALSGFGISGYDLAGAGGNATNAFNTYTIASGVVADEDINYTTSTLADGGPYTIFTRTGATGTWTWTKANTVPHLIGTTFPSYNQWTGATWQMTEGISNSYINYFVYGTTSLDSLFQFILIPGQQIHNSLAAAQAETYSSLSLGTLPFQEIVPLYQITLRTGLGVAYNGATGSCRIEAVQRIIGSRSSIAAAAVSNHESLSGIQGGSAGDHSHLTAAQAVIATQAATTSLSGYLASTDWNTFNGKQAALNGTGLVRMTGTTVAYDNTTYATDLLAAHLAGTETFTGTKTFSGGISVNGFVSASTSQFTWGSILMKNPNNATYNSFFSQAAGTFATILGNNIYVDGNDTGSGQIRSWNALPYSFISMAGGQFIFNAITSNAVAGALVTPTVIATLTPTSLTAPSFIKSGGTATQYLRADGSVSDSGGGTVNFLRADGTWTAPTASVTTTDDTTTASSFPVIIQSATGANPLKTSTSKLTFRPSDGYLFGTLGLFSGGFRTTNDRLVLWDNYLANWATNANDSIGINQTSYQGGATQFRDLIIYDGKGATVATFTGSSKILTLTGNLTTGGAVNVNAPAGGNAWLTLKRGTDATQISWLSWANADGTNKWGIGMGDSNSNLFKLYNYTAGAAALSIDPTNSAITFASSVSATGFIQSTIGTNGTWGANKLLIQEESANNSCFYSMGSDASTYGNFNFYVGHSNSSVGAINALALTSTGVGIGITPTAALHVKGIAQIGQNTNGTAVIDAYGTYAYYGCNTATNGMAIGSTGAAVFSSSITAVGATLTGNLVLGGNTLTTTNTTVVTNLNADMLDGLNSTTFQQRVSYGTSASNSGYYKINILPTTSWMLSFTIRLYQAYRYDDIRISGYNYGAGYWYSPLADLLNSSDTNITVQFGYDSAWNLWVAVPAAAYTGLEIIDITNGYSQVNQDWSKNFTIVNQTSLTGTVQYTQTVYRPLKYNESAASSTSLIGPGGSVIQSTSVGTAYTAGIQVRETVGYGGNNTAGAAPKLAFHWSGQVASSLSMGWDGHFYLNDNPGTGREDLYVKVLNTSGPVNISGNNALAFPTWGGTLWMQDSSWIRTNNSLWLGAGTYGNTSGITCGYGGTGPNTTGGGIFAGSIGIGTTTPSTPLYVVGAGTFTSTVTATGFIGNASSATTVVATATGTNALELVRANIADNDFFRIQAGGSASNAGWVEFATADDGTEPLYFRQYTGVFTSVTRTATILDGSGNTSFPGSVTSSASDIRFKTNIKPIENALDKVLSLTGFTYTVNELANSVGLFEDGEQMGLSAQAVQKIAPQLTPLAAVDKNEDGNSISGENYLTVRYERIAPLLVEAIKAQQEQINKQQEQINQLLHLLSTK